VRVRRNRVIALGIVAAVLFLLVLCLGMGIVSREADEIATRMFQKNLGGSSTKVRGSNGHVAEAMTFISGSSPIGRPTYRRGVVRVDGRIMTIRAPRPSNPALN